MIPFILKSWKRQKGRFTFLLIGALLISGGLSTLIGLSETNKGTVVNSLQKKWVASYDIVVRPKGVTSSTEQKKLLDPNYLSGISGGISLKDYEKIKKIQDIKVAAPISMIGFSGYNTIFQNIDTNEPGIYRLTETTTDNDGIHSTTKTSELYFSRGIYDLPSISIHHKYGFVGFENKLSSYTPVLLAAIDPIEEAKLVGLDKAMLPIQGKKKYFSNTDQVSSNDLTAYGIHAKETVFPVVLSNSSTLNQIAQFKIEKLNIPYSDQKARLDSLRAIEKNGGEKYLKTLPAVDTKSFTFNSEDAYKSLMENLTGLDPTTGKQIHNYNVQNVDFKSILVEKTGPLKYQSIESPFPERWKNAFQIIPYEGETKASINNTYRKPQLTDPTLKNNPRLSPYFIGFYDPKKLNLLKDPVNELPMETYKVPAATLVLNQDGLPINPPKAINPTSNIYGYLMQSPTMLTTIEAAKQILGDKPISAIRIKVKGVDTLGDDSQKKLESVVKEIKNQTGLESEITLGSSPQPVLINIPKVRNQKAIGWLEQTWINIGASISIFKEAKLGYSGIILCNILVAIIYVFSTCFVSFLSRKQEFAVLLSLGWKPKQLKKMVMTESLLIGILASIITLFVQRGMGFIKGNTSSIFESLLLTFFVLIIYIIGPFVPMYLINKIHPSLVMKKGETNSPRKRFIKTRGLFSLVFNTVIGRIQRNLISITVIALPAALLILFMYITFRLKGVLYTSWLGQYVAMEVGKPQYVAVVISLIISVLTTSEILWLNIKERSNEISLLKALGWRNNDIRMMVLAEGSFIGLIGGLIGCCISLVILYFMYGPIPVSELWFPLLTCFSLIIVGTAGSWYPSRLAMKIETREGMNRAV